VDHNICYPPYFFRMRNIDPIPHFFWYDYWTLLKKFALLYHSRLINEVVNADLNFKTFWLASKSWKNFINSQPYILCLQLFRKLNKTISILRWNLTWTDRTSRQAEITFEHSWNWMIVIVSLNFQEFMYCIVNLTHHKFSRWVGYSQWLPCRGFHDTILLSVVWLELWSVLDISGIVVMIWIQYSRFSWSPSFINKAGSQKPANRLKIRPQYIDFSCLNPVWKMRLYPSVILIRYQIH